MKKTLLSLLLCYFAFIGVAQAQNAVEGINLQKNSDFVAMVANDRATTDVVLLSYVGADIEEVTVVGIGMPFSWGAMFPASMLAQYVGTQLTTVIYVDGGEEQYAGTYEVRIYLGGELGGENLVCQQEFQVEGVESALLPIVLDNPITIDGNQNLWVMYYQDGTVQSPALAVADAGDPNDRWISVDGYGWLDFAMIPGAEGYCWLIWAYLDGWDMIGEDAAEVAVYPNPASSSVTVQAKDMNHITVLNTLGQMVYDTNVEGDLQNLDMSQYEAGVYMVRVTTENGVSVQRVVVK